MTAVAAVAAAQPQEAVGQDAAFEEGVELVLHRSRQVGAGSDFSLGEEGRGVLLHQVDPGQLALQQQFVRVVRAAGHGQASTATRAVERAAQHGPRTNGSTTGGAVGTGSLRALLFLQRPAPRR